MYQLEEQLSRPDRVLEFRGAAQQLGHKVIGLLQAEDQETIGTAYLRDVMVESRVASNEFKADFTLLALKELGFIGIDIFTTEVRIYRDENGAIITPNLVTDQV